MSNENKKQTRTVFIYQVSEDNGFVKGDREHRVFTKTRKQADKSMIRYHLTCGLVDFKFLRTETIEID